MLAAAAPAHGSISVSVQDGVPVPEVTGSTGDFVSAFSPDLEQGVKWELVRGGGVVAKSDDESRQGGIEVRTGDVVRVLNRVTGGLLVEVPFDGNPILDPSVCVGSAAFSGKRSGNATVSNVSAFKYKTTTRTTSGRYGNNTFKDTVESEVITGEVTELAGEVFRGTFDRPLTAGYIVSSSQTRRINPEVSLHSTVERPVTESCPAPAPPAPTANEIVKRLLDSAAAQLRRLRLRTLTAGRTLTINGINVDRAGELTFQFWTTKAPKKVDPTATAAQKKKKKAKKKSKKKTKALRSALIGSGRSVFFAPTTNGTVRVKPSKSAKSLLRGRKSARLIVRSIFTPANGPAVASDTRLTVKR